MEIALFNQTVAIAPTIGLVANTTSLFLLAVYMTCSVQGYFGDNAQLFISWNDETSAQQWIPAELELNNEGNLVNPPVQVIRLTEGSSLTYSTSYSAYASAAYNLFLNIKRI